MSGAADLSALIDALLLSESDFANTLEQQRFTGSGPGGQKRNRVRTAVRLRHPESGLSAEGKSSRDSQRNLSAAVHTLRLLLALLAAGRFAAELAAAPEETIVLLDGFRSRAPTFRMPINPQHADFPGQAFVALALLARHGADHSETARSLGLSPSSLVRFLKMNGSIWQAAQGLRQNYGRKPLR